MKKFSIDNQALKEIRDNVDYQSLFSSLGLIKDEKRSREADWWTHSPITEEQTPSFHMNINTGAWYCFSTHQGGGSIELIQKLIKNKGRLNCYQAGKWLIDNGISHITGEARKEMAAPLFQTARSEEKKKNKAIRQTLLKSLTQQGEHEEFKKRGISPETCSYLGCGFLPLENSKSSLAGRIIFQIRGIEENKPVILSHIGRATTEEQKNNDGKWNHYGGFSKSLELYNLDKIYTDPRALKQIEETGKLIVVEGCFDVAKILEAGIYNVVGIFGAFASDYQIELLKKQAEKLKIKNILFWMDNDKAGKTGLEKNLEGANDNNIFKGFNWDQEFQSIKRGNVKIPLILKDPCMMTTKQIQWFRKNKII